MSWPRRQGYNPPKGNRRCDGCNWSVRMLEPDASLDDHLVIRTRSLYQGGPSALDVPSVVGSYSVDSEKNIHFDNSMMPFLNKNYAPSNDECMQVKLDLNRGWHRVNGYTGTTAESFKQFLHWIIMNQKKLLAEDSSNKLMVDFICTRGILKTVMNAPYVGGKNAEMTVLAQYFKGSVYMKFQYEEFEGERKKDSSTLPEIYGHKFEQYMTGGDPDEILECNCQFRCVLKQHLNELSLLYTVAIDAVDKTLYQHDFKDLTSFVRLKVRKDLIPTQPWYSKNYLNGWWNETQLSGIPRILMGIRNSEGIVHTIQMLQAAKIPDMVEKNWEPSVCINFLVKFLNFVKEKVVSEPHVVHRFQRSSLASCHIHHSHDTSLKDILPKWYTMQLFKEDDTD